MPDHDALDAAPDPEVAPGQMPDLTDAAGGDAAPADSADGESGAADPGAMPMADAPSPNPDQPPASPATLASAPIAAAPVEQPAPRINDAMRVISRMQTDLDVATGGKRPATHQEVDTAFDNTIKALGIRLPLPGMNPGGLAAIAQPSGAAAPDTGGFAAPEGDHPLAVAAAGGAGASAASGDPAAVPSPSDTTNEAPGNGTPAQSPAKADPAAATPGPATNLKREWPVPIPATGLHLPLRGEQDSRGKTYSNGQFSLTGAYRTQNGKPHKHEGDDVPDPLDTPVNASADGVVTFVGTEWKMIQAMDPKTHKPLWKMVGKKRKPVMVQAPGPVMAGYGHYVKILHPDGYETLYGHLRAVPPLKQGMSVRLGQEIGRLGDTGNAAGGGSHVHFGVRNSRTGAWVDPAKWIAGELPPAVPRKH